MSDKEQPGGDEPAPAEQPEAVLTVEAWARDNYMQPGPDGAKRDERESGLTGGFVHQMRADDKGALRPAEYQAEWKKFLRREV